MREPNPLNTLFKTLAFSEKIKPRQQWAKSFFSLIYAGAYEISGLEVHGVRSSPICYAAVPRGYSFFSRFGLRGNWSLLRLIYG
jgi:hypothetical protein